jgi:hypothetical protein
VDLVQSDLCFFIPIPDIRDNSACIALGGRVDLAGDSVSESEAVGNRFLASQPLMEGGAYLDILVVLPRRRSVISAIRELFRPGIVDVLDLVNTFFGKLRYGPVSTSLPWTSVGFGVLDLQIVNSGRPSRIVHRLFLPVILIKSADPAVERGSELNDQNRK